MAGQDRGVADRLCDRRRAAGGSGGAEGWGVWVSGADAGAVLGGAAAAVLGKRPAGGCGAGAEGEVRVDLPLWDYYFNTIERVRYIAPVYILGRISGAIRRRNGSSNHNPKVRGRYDCESGFSIVEFDLVSIFD